MAKVISRSCLCSLQTSDCLSSPSWRALFASPVSSGPSLRNAVRQSYQATSPFPSSASCSSRSRSKYLVQAPIFRSLQIFEARSINSRVATCFRFRRGDGEHGRSLMWLRAEAVAESLKASSSSRDVWESIALNSAVDRPTEDDGGRWTQSVHVDVSTQHQIELTAVQHDVGMAVVVLFGAFVWVRLFDFFTSKHILGQKLSRKIVHITSGLLYMLCWPFFSTSKWAPFIAGLVPLANGIRLIIYGFEILKDEGLVKSMSRSGESRELLRGPLYYVMVLYFSTIFFWRQSPVGMIALSMMCGGDGIADIMGRKFGSKKLPYNRNKSFAGSIAMFLFGFLVSSVCVYYFTLFGFFKLDLYGAAMRLALISLVATIVESLPITTQLDDNFTVPATTFLLGIAFFSSPS